MKTLLLAGAAALALTACNDLTVGGVTITKAQQACIAPAAAAAVAELPGDLSYTQKGAALAVAGEQIATDCGVDISAVKPFIDAALMAASAANG